MAHDQRVVRAVEQDAIQDAISRVLRRGTFALGPETELFEYNLGRYLGVLNTVGVASGADAIQLVLKAAGIGRGSEVIASAFGPAARISAIEQAGAIPVLVDVDPITFTLDPDAVAGAITTRTAAILASHEAGQMADMAGLLEIAHHYGLILVEDCGFSIGARQTGQRAGTFADVATFDFAPGSNLPACGSAGAIATGNSMFSDRIRRLRNAGMNSAQVQVDLGTVSTIDEIQAVILDIRLGTLDQSVDARRAIAGIYDEHIEHVVRPSGPVVNRNAYSSYIVQHGQRRHLQRALRDRLIDARPPYPAGLHQHPAYLDLYGAMSLPLSEKLASSSLWLPMYPHLEPGTAIWIARSVNEIAAAL